MILAIIAVITVPIVLNIIENSRKGGITISVYGYRDAVNKYYVLKLEDDGNFKFDGNYLINSNGNLQQNGIIYGIETSGKNPSGGLLKYRNNVILEGCVIIANYKVMISDGKSLETVSGEC